MIFKGSVFDWDAGNEAKCQKHGVTLLDIEFVFRGDPMIRPNRRADGETRFSAIGETPSGRSVFLVFTIRKIGDVRRIRPVSARFMHAREISAYERAKRP